MIKILTTLSLILIRFTFLGFSKWNLFKILKEGGKWHHQDNKKKYEERSFLLITSILDSFFDKKRAVYSILGSRS